MSVRGRAPRSRRGVAVTAAAWIGCAAYAGLALASGLDRMAAADRGLAARLPSAISAQALGSRGQAQLERGDVQGALRTGESMVARVPLDPLSTALLGAARLASEDPAGADQAFRVAGQLGWRIPLTQAYWLNRAMAAGDTRVASQRLDALLRQNPGLLANRLLMDSVEGSDQGRRAMVDRMLLGPNWLARYMSDVSELPAPYLLQRARVLSELTGRGARIDCNALAPTVRALVAANGIAPAVSLWRQNCPKLAGTPLSDGNFAALAVTPPPTPFQWELVGSSDLTTDLVRSAKGQTIVVRNSAPHRRAVLRQYIVASPGTYQLRWRTGTEATQPFAASISCTPEPAGWLSATVDPQSRESVTAVTVDSACAGHWLTIAAEPSVQDASLEAVRMIPAGAAATAT